MKENHGLKNKTIIEETNEDEETNYIHVSSDHSASILKQLPMSIEELYYHLYHRQKKFSKKLRHNMNSTSQTGDTKKS